MIVWAITGLKVAQTPQANTVTEAVYSATHAAGIVMQGSATLGPPSVPFVPYGALSEQQVLTWLWAFVDKDATEALLNKRVAQADVVRLPWENEVAAP